MGACVVINQNRDKRIVKIPILPPLQAGPTILDVLPPELLQLIIAEHSEDRADIQAVSRTCHALHYLTISPALEAAWLWRRHGDQALFHIPTNSLSLAVLRQLVEVHHADVSAQRVGDGIPLLHRACHLDRPELVEFLISDPRINVNLTWGDEDMTFTSLHVGCAAGSVRAVQQLLALPQIQVNAVTSQGYSSLNCACIGQKREVVEMLLKHPDIDVNLAEGSAQTPLVEAAMRGDSAIMTMLLRHPEVQINAAGVIGMSPLCVATFFGHVEASGALLRHPGTEVNAIAPAAGLSSLGLACARGHLDVIRELLECPALDAGSIRAAFAVAEGMGLTAVVELLRGHRAGRRALRGRGGA